MSLPWRLPRVAASPLRTILRAPGTARFKRYAAFDSQFDQEALADARAWFQDFEESQLPNGATTFARSSGPGGQHVNKTESKATTVYPVKELLEILPRHLHEQVRRSKYYAAGSDSLIFQAQTQRSRTANTDENRRKLLDEVRRIYRETTPAATTGDKMKKHAHVKKRFHETRIKDKKVLGAKKQSRRGPLG